MLVLAGAGTRLAIAAASQPPDHPFVFHPKWRLISRDSVNGITASGSYVLLGNSTTSLGTLIDTRANQQRQILPPPNCAYGYGDDVLSAPWLLRLCGVNGQPDAWLYSLSRHTWRDIGAPGPVLRQGFDCGGVGACLDEPTVGRYWIGWSFSCNAHCVPSSLPAGFSNIQTGAWRPQSSSSTTIDDPDSRALNVRLCRPLRVPRGGSIAFYGRFAVIDQRSVGGPHYLERCASHLRERIGSDTTGNSRELIWNPGATKLDGMLLPSLRRFVIPLGQDMPGGRTEVLLSGRTLYANRGSSVWAAPAPRAPRR